MSRITLDYAHDSINTLVIKDVTDTTGHVLVGADTAATVVVRDKLARTVIGSATIQYMGTPGRFAVDLPATTFPRGTRLELDAVFSDPTGTTVLRTFSADLL